MRPVTKLVALAALLLPCACASTRWVPVEPKPPKTPLRGGIAEFRLISYDRRDLRGRVLLGATVDTLVINGEMIEDRELELEKIRACSKTEVIEHYIVDCFGPTRASDVVTLRKGYWHGTNAHFFLWDNEIGLGPDCFEAELVLYVLDGRVAATLPIKVVRTDKPPTTPTGAAEEPKTPAPEGRAP